jgi:dynein heavy chain
MSHLAFACLFLEQPHLEKLFVKYVPSTIDMIVEGIVDGKQVEKLKTIVLQTDLNMVGTAWPS